ncbi:hypothetical protein SCLCIDRAFT_812104 [Scleroderma citrinum Foug A]|uniref:Uncharacterized protein n=1 Tax=Scleroderma citrinum Foug A TaxID=1036808 RepID=A0A0C3A5R6_9AGAM|nr:hypothetical protein SCLCIDRAFT_812104 [Scleroderma citrinum Foug A]
MASSSSVTVQGAEDPACYRMLTSIKTEGDKIEIVNQLLLPHSTEYIEINTIEEAHDAIKTMKASLASFQEHFLVDIFLTDPRRTCHCIAGGADFCSQPIQSSRNIASPALLLLSRSSPGARHVYPRLPLHRTADGC